MPNPEEECDHIWELNDYDGYYYEVCLNCDEERPYEPRTCDDDVI